MKIRFWVFGTKILGFRNQNSGFSEPIHRVKPCQASRFGIRNTYYVVNYVNTRDRSPSARSNAESP